MKDKLRKIAKGAGFSPPAYLILRLGLILSCLMLASSLLIAMFAIVDIFARRRASRGFAL